jgi:dUTP pyrophosphatase
MIKIFRVKLRENDDTWMPIRAHKDDAGFDLRARTNGLITIEPHKTRLIKTGVFIELKPGWEAQIRPRSGMALDADITVLNAPGTIDAGYRNEIGVILHNSGTWPVHIGHGNKIAQMVIKELPFVFLEKSESIDSEATERGQDGFGSTGA